MNCRTMYIGQTEPVIACDRVVGKGTGVFYTDTVLFTSPIGGRELKRLVALPTYMWIAMADKVIHIQLSEGLQPRGSLTLRRCAAILIEPYSDSELQYINVPDCEVYRFDPEAQQVEHIAGPNSVEAGIDIYYYDLIENGR
jgi:hypothetical protein